MSLDVRSGCYVWRCFISDRKNVAGSLAPKVVKAVMGAMTHFGTSATAAAVYISG